MIHTKDYDILLIFLGCYVHTTTKGKLPQIIKQ